MPLPINIEQILFGRSIESERVEYKAGWNPEEILHTVCAFANDLHNLGGGYIFIGIAEKDGKPILPPVGLKDNQIDSIQKKLVELCHRLYPHYFPIVFPDVYKGKHFLVLWCPGGDVRPYKAPVSLSAKEGSAFYIRRMSTTVKATGQTEQELLSYAAKVPFDDRINQNASLDDIDIGLIRTFLQQTGSALFHTAHTLPMEDLCRQMQIARGPAEMLRPINAGLLFFSQNPQKYFPGAIIEIVEYKDDIGDSFAEKKFYGPIYLQLREALTYLKNMHVSEFVRKISGKAEAQRFYNYPYEAIEEALANAVYHRGYDLPNTIEINVRLDCIEILSYPGPVPPVDNKLLQRPRVVARNYRNRRIGDFLKELSLTEGRSTGIPKMIRACKRNGSPLPKFETDDDRTYFLTTIPIHPYVQKSQPTPKGAANTKSTTGSKASQGASQGTSQGTRLTIRILHLLLGGTLSRNDIASKLQLKPLSRFFRETIIGLKQEGFIEHTIPDKPNSRFQQYRITRKGKRRLNSNEV
jgi:ATP-dependent DNA helicase RecG